jgi:hypothetical protein
MNNRCQLEAAARTLAVGDFMLIVNVLYLKRHGLRVINKRFSFPVKPGMTAS